MKPFTIIGLAVTSAVLGWFLFKPNPAPPLPLAKASTTRQLDAPTSVKNDPTEIFQRAFWKRPTDADKILHAERREWADANGLKKWQWFIVLEPSPALGKYLRDDNAFGLISAPKPPTIQQAPPWFTIPSEEIEVLQSLQETMFFVISKTKNILYATDSGAGFQPGTPEAAQAPPPPSSTHHGRLPDRLPPRTGPQERKLKTAPE